MTKNTKKSVKGINKSVFSKPRNITNFLDRRKLKAKGTVENDAMYLRKFDNYLKLTYNKSNEAVLNEILDLPSEERERTLFDIFQDFIHYLDSTGIGAKFIRSISYTLKAYLRFYGFKITSEDVKDNVVLPKVILEEREPLTRETLQLIINSVTGIRRVLYLVMSSTGMREVEALQIKKSDLELNQYERILVKIPAKITKTKKYRETFISKESAKELLPYLENMKDDDIIFNPKGKIYKRRRINELQTFDRLRKKIGLDVKYESGVNKVTLGLSLRSWFVSKTNRIDYGFGHALAGHEQYMKSYDRWSREDKLKFYLKAERLLQVFDYTDEDQAKRIESDGKRITDLEDKLDSIKEILERLKVS